MLSTKEIVEVLKKEEITIKEQFAIEHLALFGSYARNNQSENSDLDLIYDMQSGIGMTLGRLRRLEDFLNQRIQVSKLELVNRKFLNPIVFQRAKNEIIELF